MPEVGSARPSRHEDPTALVAVDDRIRCRVSQSVQLARRELQVAAAAGAAHEPCRADAAEL